jgi:hypothetical protein
MDTGVSGGPIGFGPAAGLWHGVSRKHVGVDKRDGTELKMDEPDTDPRVRDMGSWESRPGLVSIAARFSLVSRGLCPNDGLVGSCSGWLVDVPGSVGLA